MLKLEAGTKGMKNDLLKIPPSWVFVTLLLLLLSVSVFTAKPVEAG